jgi:hypothetical protein
MGFEPRIKELDAWIDYLAITNFCRDGMLNLLASNCKITVLGRPLAALRINALEKARQAGWIVEGLEERHGAAVDVIDALFNARRDKFLTLYKNGCHFAWIKRDGNAAQLSAPGVGITIKLWTDRPALSLLIDTTGHFHLTKRFGWVLFVQENEREALLSPT